MLIVSIMLVLALLILICIVDFVLSNLAMFQTPFDIVIRIPFTQWSRTWEGVEFMYLIAGSVLLGALVVALSTWVLDTKRKLKLRNVRKELKRLQEDLKKTKAAFPKEDVDQQENVRDDETTEFLEDSSSATPEKISKSFEDAVEDGEFLQETPEEIEDESVRQYPEVEEEPALNEERQLAQTSEKVEDESVWQTPETEEDPAFNEEKQLAQETPVEAELVDSEEFLSEEPSTEETTKSKEDKKITME